MEESEESGHCPVGHVSSPKEIPPEFSLRDVILASPIETYYGDFVECSVEEMNNLENEMEVAEDEEKGTEKVDTTERNAAAEEKDAVKGENIEENAMEVTENEEKATENGDSAEKDVAGEEKDAAVEEKNGENAMDEEKNEGNSKEEAEEDYEAAAVEEKDENEEKTRIKLKNKQKVEATLKGKEKELRKRRIRMKLEQRGSKKLTIRDDHKPESLGRKETGGKKEPTAVQEVRNGQNSKDDEEKKEENAKQEEEENNEAAVIEGEDEGGENKKGKEKDNVKVEATSKGKLIRSRATSRRKNVEQKGSKKVTSGDQHKPDTSGRKRAESMGMIFMCSSKTKKDCYRYKVLGLPANKREIVEKVYKGMRLFLFDFDLKLLYGIYKAMGPGGYNIEPKAFNSAFPSQVRFTVLEDCSPLAEETFRKVIKDNYYTRTKFDCQLNAEQVKKLCKLFITSNRGSKSTKSSRGLRAEGHTAVDRDRMRRHGLDERARTYAEPDRIRQRGVDDLTHRTVERYRIRQLVLDEDRQKPDRIRQRGVDDLTHRTVERDRIRQQVLDEDRRSALSGECRYEHPAMYEREAFASNLVPSLPPQTPPSYAFQRALSLPPQTPPSYAFQSALDTDAYRRDPVLEHRYLQIRDIERRRRDEIGSQDLYGSYRQPALYHDRLYSPGLPAEYHLSTGQPPENRSVGLLTDYHSARPEPDHRHFRYPY